MPEEWNIVIYNDIEYLILKKDDLTKEYSLVRKPVNNAGDVDFLRYFTAESDDEARNMGYELAREYGLA